MEQLRSKGFVHHDTLQVIAEPDLITIKGEIACLGNIVITVCKFIPRVGTALDGEPMIETSDYAYNASVRGYGTIMRVDNAHPHPGHQDSHHQHFCDWRLSNETELPGSPKWLGEQGWPTLGQFIDWVADWYWEHRDELPEPEAVPELDLRSRP